MEKVLVVGLGTTAGFIVTAPGATPVMLSAEELTANEDSIPEGAAIAPLYVFDKRIEVDPSTETGKRLQAIVDESAARLGG